MDLVRPAINEPCSNDVAELMRFGEIQLAMKLEAFEYFCLVNRKKGAIHAP